MKKYLLTIFLVIFCFVLSAEDLVLKNGRRLPGFCGIGTVAPVPRSNYNKWGIIVYFANGKKRTVVEVQNFPNDFPHMKIVRKRAEDIPRAKAAHAAKRKAETAEAKEELAQYNRLKKIASAGEKTLTPKFKESPKKETTKRKDFKRKND